MTYAEAMEIRLRQINRQPVDAAQAAEAMLIIQAARGKAPASRQDRAGATITPPPAPTVQPATAAPPAARSAVVLVATRVEVIDL